MVANATGTGTASTVTANANVVGVEQNFFGTVAADGFVSNSGTMSVTANALAVAGRAAVQDTASANAAATGVQQFSISPASLATVVNEGTLNVGANATATAQEVAVANASALGVFQSIGGSPNLVFTNNGEMNVIAVAAATATGDVPVNATANAIATGYFAFASPAAVTAVNSGTLFVSANAVAGNRPSPAPTVSTSSFLARRPSMWPTAAA